MQSAPKPEVPPPLIPSPGSAPTENAQTGITNWRRAIAATAATLVLASLVYLATNRHRPTTNPPDNLDSIVSNEPAPRVEPLPSKQASEEPKAAATEATRERSQQPPSDPPKHPIWPTRHVDRQVAERVIELGGSVDIDYRRVGALSDLPIKPFRVQNVYLSGCHELTKADFELIGGLRYVGAIDVGQSSITDEQLQCLRHLRSLDQLFLQNTAIGDDGVAALSGLKRLSKLALNGTSVTDKCMESLSQLTNLESLDLSAPGVTGSQLSILSRLPSLRSLTLANAAINDDCLKGLAEVKELRSLNLEGTNVTGKGLYALNELPHLHALFLYGSRVAEEATEAFAGMRSLQALAVNGTAVNDKIIEKLATMRDLRALFIDDTQITNLGREQLAKALPKSNLNPEQAKMSRDVAGWLADTGGKVCVGFFPGLGKRWVSASNDLPPDPLFITDFARGDMQILDDAGLQRICNAACLESLDAHQTAITDEGLKCLKDQGRLETLNLCNTSITDTGLSYLSACPDLRKVQVCDTQVTGRELAALSHVDGWIDLSGSPISYQDLKDAPVLNCRGFGVNRCKDFDDRCAAVVARFNELEELQAQDCPLTDAGLEHFATLAKLRRLSVWNDRITDAGIAHIGALKELVSLDLPPRITDAALATIGELRNLQQFGLLNNPRITDAGLPHLAKLEDLYVLHLEGTKVTKEGVAKLQEALPDCEIFSDVAAPFTFMPTTPLAPAPTTTHAASPSKTDADAAGSKPLNQNSTGWHGWPADAPPPAIAPFDEEQARKHQQAWADYLKLPLEYTNTIGMKFILIPPGEFLMGSTVEEIEEALKEIPADAYGWMKTQWQGDFSTEAPQHKVVVTKAFYLGTHEVTQKEYEAVMGANPSYLGESGNVAGLVAALAGLDTADHPVGGVNWNDAADFCAKLSKQEQLKPFYFRAGETVSPLKGEGYRLPTEAEWEFACRAGTTTRFWNSDESPAGWWKGNAAGRTHSVGGLPANAFGLFDVYGNVWEWMEDAWEPTFYASFSEKAAMDPKRPFADGSKRILRGGDWGSPRVLCRSSYRGGLDAAQPDPVFGCGLRVALPINALRRELPAARPSGAAPPAAAAPKSEAERPEAKATSGIQNSTGWHGWSADAPAPAIAPFDEEQARKHQQVWADYLKLPLEHTNTIGMKFILIPPGEFLMGSTPEEIEEALKWVNPDDQHWRDCIKSETPAHKVVLTQPFYFAVHELTQKEHEVVTGKNPSFFAKTGPDPQWTEKVANLDTANHPVEGVSWNDAAEFCSELSEHEGLKPFYFRAAEAVTLFKGTGYRLATEAEWEFACRAGTTTKYFNGGESPAGWWAANSGERTHEVEESTANPFGLFDVHGNVFEWVEDGWEPTYYAKCADKLAINPRCPFSAGSQHVSRGGNWLYSASFCRSSNRYLHGATSRHNDIGIRVVLAIDALRREQ